MPRTHRSFRTAAALMFGLVMTAVGVAPAWAEPTRPIDPAAETEFTEPRRMAVPLTSQGAEMPSSAPTETPSPTLSPPTSEPPSSSPSNSPEPGAAAPAATETSALPSETPDATTEPETDAPSTDSSAQPPRATATSTPTPTSTATPTSPSTPTTAPATPPAKKPATPPAKATTTPPTASPSPDRTPAKHRDAVLDLAADLSGIPYVWGGTSTKGFDCSGYTQHVFAKAGITLPRTAAQQQDAVTRVKQPRPGDLVFFGSPAHHVGIYAGDGRMYDAPRRGKTTGLHRIWSSDVTYGRP